LDHQGDNMELNEYQDQCNRQDGSVMYPEHGTGSLIAFDYCASALTGEAGEILNKLKKIKRGDPGKTLDSQRLPLKKELGGVFWYLAMASMELGFTLDEIAESNLDEIKGRQQRGTLQGDGDNR